MTNADIASTRMFNAERSKMIAISATATITNDRCVGTDAPLSNK